MADDAPVVYWQTEAGPPARLQVGSVVGRTLDTYGTQLPLFLALSLPIAFVAGAFAAFPATLGEAGVAGIVGAAVAGGVVAFLSSIAMLVATDEVWSGREPTMAELARRSLPRSPALLGTYLALVLALAAFVGAFALGVAVLPAAVVAIVAVVLFFAILYAALRLTPLGQVIILEGIGGFASIRRSWDLTNGSLWRIVGLLTLIGLITLPASIGSQLITALSGTPVMAGLAALLAALVTSSLLAIALTIAWADLAERPYADTEVVRRGRGRRPALAVVLGFGILLTAIGVSIGGATGFAGLLPQPGVILAGATRNQLDPCRPMDVRTQFRSGEDVWIGGYLREPIPAGRQGTVDLHRDGTVLSSEPVESGARPTACWYVSESLRGAQPGAYRIVIRYADRTIAEGSFVIEP